MNKKQISDFFEKFAGVANKCDIDELLFLANRYESLSLDYFEHSRQASFNGHHNTAKFSFKEKGISGEIVLKF